MANHYNAITHLRTETLRELEVGDLRLLHHGRLPDRGDGVARVVRHLGVGEVLRRVLLPRLEDVGARDGVEDRDLLRAEGDDGHRLRRADLAAAGVLVGDVRRDLHGRDGERGEREGADGDTPDGDEEVVVGGDLVDVAAEQTPGGHLHVGEVRNGVVDRGRSVAGGDEPGAGQSAGKKRRSVRRTWQ